MQILPPEVSAPRISGGVSRMNDATAERRRRLAEVAYSLGLRRGFEGGIEQAIEDWVEAGRIVDQRVREAANFRV